MGKLKKVSPSEKKFAWLIVNGLSPVEAAKRAFKWKCESYSKENIKAYNLAKTPRIKKEIEDRRHQLEIEAEVQNRLITSDGLCRETLRKFCTTRLEEIRDDPNKPARNRFDAIRALEKLADPSTDVNLIWRWIDVIWRGGKAHCPRCHSNFPLWKVENKSLEAFRLKNDLSLEHPEEEDEFTRRMELIRLADRRKKPHPGQVRALKAPERNLVGKGAARSGKSYLLSLLAFMGLLTPGVEIWVLARIYEDARSEVEYLRGFLKSLFYPVDKYLFKERIDKKSGEVILETKWGSELRIKSAKAQGSVTGRELEMCLIAEPAWVPDELYEEVRARMSSRLGRILAFGTPKGYGGFLSRMINQRGIDPNTGKVIRIKEEDRLIRNGAKWTESMLVYSMSPEENPEYVVSELEAARKELTEAEYAAEFRGEMTAEEGAKFSQVKEHMIRRIRREEYEKCSFVQGIDQGPKNFGGVLAAWDGVNAYVCREYFDNSNRTIKANLLKLRSTGPMLIEHLGGHKEHFKLTIFDQDPPIDNILTEMDVENNTWPTAHTYRHRNQPSNMDNWRDETTIWINQMAKDGKLIFDEDCDQLLWQVLECLNKPKVEGKEGKSPSDKGWVVRDPWRGDHVLDAWLMAMWTIASGQIELPPEQYEIKKGWEDHKAAFDYRMAKDEARELGGYVENSPKEEKLFEDYFGRPRRSRSFLQNSSYYSDY